jgi:hypothetical protein
MIRDPGRVTDGFASLERGVDSGRNPSLLGRNQVAWAENVTFRGGYLVPRPGWKRIGLVSASNSVDYTVALAEGKFQGAEFYDDTASGKGYLMCQAGGRLFRLAPDSPAVVLDITPANDPNSAVIPQAWMVQAENYFVVQDGQSKPMIFDGTSTRRATDNEVPIGSGPMAYGMLRLWVAMGNTYVAGDVAGGPTSVVSFTENTYIAEGGEFSLPLATPNTALGQGELLIFTPGAVFSNTAPVDRDQWKNLTQPVQTITLINNGSQSQASTVLVNGDIFMRSRDGIRSVIQAVRYFQQWGNTPLSKEMTRVIARDDLGLLNFSSAVEFDNRMLMTCRPEPLANGAYHNGVIALDFDLVTSMSEKSPPAYDGVWTGPQIYQLVKGRFSGVERCFAFARSQTDGFLTNVIVTNQGSGFTSVPDVILTGGGGTGAEAVAHVEVATFTVAVAGTGYVVGDMLVCPSVNNSPSAVVTAVNGSGGVTAVTLVTRGDDTLIPANPLTCTTGTGTGCKLNATWRIKSVVPSVKGTGYTSAPTVSFSAGNAAAVATIDFRMELWELTRDAQFDYDLDGDGNPVEKRIKWFFESPSYGFNGQESNASELKRLETGDLWVDRVSGTVDFQLRYRPDQYPCWNPWHAWQVCAARCIEFNEAGCVFTDFKEQYRPRMILPQPPDLDEPVVAKSMRTGYEFSVRLDGQGPCRIKLLRLHAKKVVEAVANPVVATAESTCGKLSCECDG